MSKVGSGADVLKVFDTDELLALVRLDLEQNRAEQALFKLKHMLANDPGNAEVLSISGKVYAQLRLFDKAKNCFKQFLEINPESVVDKFQYGMVHFDSADEQKALAIWEELLTKQPTHPPALFYKGLVLARQNKMADAKQTLSILLQSAPADNLYFGKAKELLQAIDRGESDKMVEREKSEAAGKGIFAKDAYKSVN